MTLPITTARGGKVSIHFGKVTTTNLFGSWVEVTDVSLILELKNACKTYTSSSQWNDLIHKYSPAEIASKTRPYTRTICSDNIDTSAPSPSPSFEYESPKETTPDLTAARVAVCQKIQAFFSEFSFSPANRFVNTLSKQDKLKSGKAYVLGYMELCNQPDTNDIREKIKSSEFMDIFKELTGCKSDKTINNRVRLYYGDPGTGKTTRAIKEFPDAKVFICNSAMLGDDLLQVFDFNDENGNPVFKPSVIQEAMIAGKPVILDEINLLSLDALRTLQEITDDKSVVSFRGKDIQIADGFKIIGTMNLMINGQPYPLPEALVDRAEYIEHFELAPDLLAQYAF